MRTKITLGMLTIYLVWGSTYLAIRYGIETIPPFLLAGSRFFTAGIILFLLRRLAGDPLPTRRQWLSAAGIGLLMLTCGNGLITWSELRIDSGIAALLGGTVPIWMVLIDSLFFQKSKPNREEVLGLVVGFAGVVVLVSPGNFWTGMSRYDLLGSGAVVVASLFWSLGSILSKKADLPGSPLMGTSLEMLAGSAGLAVASLLTAEWTGFELSAVSARSFAGLLYLISFGSLGAFAAYTWLLRNAPTPLVSTYAFVNPMVAILLGIWLGGEPFSLHLAFAMSMIVGSVILINHGRQKNRHP